MACNYHWRLLVHVHSALQQRGSARSRFCHRSQFRNLFVHAKSLAIDGNPLMKTDLIKFTRQWIKNLRGILAGLITTLIFFNVLPKAWSVDLFWADNATSPATAGSGTWAAAQFSGPISWSTKSTSPPTTAWIDGSVAHFLGSGGGTVTLGSPIKPSAINFDTGANTFNIDTNANTLTIDGAGIVNNSGKTQTITN